MGTPKSNRTRAYERRLRDLGYIRVSAWIPPTEDARTKLHATAKELREAHPSSSIEQSAEQ